MSASSKPIRIAVIGAGHHSRTFHLPALAHYRHLHPNVVTLAGLADPDVGATAAAAGKFGFESFFATTEEMLEKARPHACLALTPATLNAGTTLHLAQRGLPVLMEKPLGATIEEARLLVASLRGLNARVMVSMNRRFDPLLRDALAWIGSRPIHSIQASMTRRARVEPEFVEHTGVHVVDVARMIGGEVKTCSALRREVAGIGWFEARLSFASGATGIVELMPTFGSSGESLEIAGPNYRCKVRSREFDCGDWRAWVDGRLVAGESIPPTRPVFIANGALAETDAFVQALRGDRTFSPAPDDVLPSMELCHTIAHAQSANQENVP